MAVSTDNAFSGPYVANGATTVFPFTFTAPTPAEVGVEVRDTLGAVVATPSHTAFVSSGAGGSVVFSAPPSAGYTITPFLNPAFTQDIQFENGSAWQAEPVNEGYDRAALRSQALKRDVDRAIKAPISAGGIEFVGASNGQVIGQIDDRLVGVTNSVVGAEQSAVRAETAMISAETAEGGANASELVAGASAAVALAAAQNALNYGKAAIRSGFVAADAEAWTASAWVQVLSSDTGMHASKAGDVGAAGGQTPNAGVYQEDASLGLIRRAELESSLATDAANKTVTLLETTKEDIAAGANAGANIHETAEKGTRFLGGPSGERLLYDETGLHATMAFGTVGADAFGDGGKASIRAAVVAGADINVHEELDGGKYKIVAVSPTGPADILKSAAANYRWPQVVAGVISVASDQSDGTEAVVYRSYTASLLGTTILRRPLPSNAARRAFIIVGMGESLMRGGQDNAAAPLPGPYNLGTTMMPNGGVHMGVADTTTGAPVPEQALPANYTDLVPLVEPTNKQEVLGPLARRIWIEHGIPCSVINVGASGRGIREINKTAPGYAYPNAIETLKVHIAHWKRHGFVPEVLQLINLGVNDSGSGSNYTWVKQFMSPLITDFVADTRAALNNPSAEVRSFFITPMSVGAQTVSNIPNPNISWVADGIADLQYDLASAHYAGPLIGIANFDRHHPNSVGYVRMGEALYYRAIKRVLIDKLEWKALRAVKGGATLTGSTTITVPLEGNTGAVRILTDTLCPAIANSGVRVWSPAATPVERTVTSVAVMGSGPYALSITGTGFVTGDIVTGAVAPPGTSAAPADRARTNIADSDPLVGLYDTSNLPKWLGQFREIVA